MTDVRDTAVQAAVEGELKLQRCRDRASTVSRLPAETDPADRCAVTSEIKGVRLAPDLVPLAFATEHHGRQTPFSSEGE